MLYLILYSPENEILGIYKNKKKALTHIKKLRNLFPNETFLLKEVKTDL